MARFLATRNESRGEAYIASGDSFMIPKAVFDVLADRNGPFFGDWSTERRAFRFELGRAAEAVLWLRSHGHNVETREHGQRRASAHSATCCGGACADVPRVPMPADFRARISEIGKVID